MEQPDRLFSVVVPTCDRDELLPGLLASLDDQAQGLIDEVIVVFDQERVSTRRIALTRAPLRTVCTGGRRGPAFARNLGAGMARAPVLVFVDDDIRLAPHALARMARVYRATAGPLAAAGRIVPDKDVPRNVYTRFAYSGPVHSPLPAQARADYAHYCTSFAAIDRDRFRSLGGFDERFVRPGYEDVELAYRARKQGVPIVFEREAIAYHRKLMDRDWFEARCRTAGRALRLFHALHPETRRWYHRVCFSPPFGVPSAALARVMLARLPLIERLAWNMDVMCLRICHILSLSGQYAQSRHGSCLK